MKKLVFITMISLLISSCSTTKEPGISRSERRHIAKVSEQAAIKKAIESRRYIVRMDRIYMLRGGFIDLVPRNNYIIVDGGAASISLPYAGRNFGRPISGINLNGQTTKYTLEADETKGVYNIVMEVKFKNSKFDLYLNVASDGRCSLSVVNAYIESVNYSGHLIPIIEPVTGNPGKTDQL